MSNNEKEVCPKLPDWLEDFAKSQLEQIGSNVKNSKDNFEAKVRELQEKVGLYALSGVSKEAIVSTAELDCKVTDKRSDDKYDAEQLKNGIKVELEHTKDENLAKTIAKDHLDEHPRYYEFLKKMEKEMKEASNRAELIHNIIIYANALEDVGDVRGAQIIDVYINKFANDPLVFQKHPQVKVFIQDVCKARGGHMDSPALLHLIRSERKEEIDVQDEELKAFVEKCLKDARDALQEIKDKEEKYTGVSNSSNEPDKDNTEVFYTPAKK